MIRGNNRSGFTLTELIVVLVIVSVLSAVGVPILYTFVESGRQINRTNIARTLYLAAQNQLTELRLTGNLTGAAESEGLGDGADDTKVYYLLGEPSGWPDVGNEENIQYISKPTGSAPIGLMLSLLSPVLEKTVLNEAILIEFNIKTGVVLSVFYKDRQDDGFEFSYAQSAGDASISGPRGMGPAGYEPLAGIRGRRQGYYGAGDTSGLPAEISPMSISIYDSYDDDTRPDGSFSDNLLFVRVGIPAEFGGHDFTASIPGYPESARSFSPSSKTGISSSFEAALRSTGLYFEREPLNAEDPLGYNIIWILDYVGGDTTDDVFQNSYSIGGSFDPSKLITACVTDNTTGASAESFGKHPYCGAGSFGLRYSINSARHLYNIRYVLESDIQNASFLQGADIDLNKTNSEVTNFDPIPDFTGTYNGNNLLISNLAANTTGNAGLFALIAAGGGVRNLTLENASISSAGGSAGAVCGELGGFISGLFVKYGGNAADASISGLVSVGGIAGRVLAGGKIENSTFISPLPYTHISSTGYGAGIGVGNSADDGMDVVNDSSVGNSAGNVAGNTVGSVAGSVAVGGIAGYNSGTINNVLFLALAPINADGNIVPITNGAGSGVSSVYYLSGGAIRPGLDNRILDPPAAGRTDYNREKSVGPGVGMSTWELYETVNRNGGYTLSGWIKRSGLEAETQVDSRDGASFRPIYPYPFIAPQGSAVPGNPDWPIAGGITESTAGITRNID